MDKRVGDNIEKFSLEVSKGYSIREVARVHNIPFSTLRDALNRFKREPTEAQLRLRLAVKAVIEDGMSYRKAASKFNVKTTTLFDHVKTHKTKERNDIG